MHFFKRQQDIRDQLAAFRHYFPHEVCAYPTKVRILLEYIHANLFEPSLSVGRALGECQFGSASIHGRFRQHTGFTIGQYIEHGRMMAAMWLLADERLPMHEIAFAVGYINYSTFRRAFKRHVGCPPSVYRDRIPGIN